MAKLSPLISEVLAPLAEAGRVALGLADNVAVTVDNSRRQGSGVDLRIHLPNGVDLDVRLLPAAESGHAWKTGAHLALTLRGRTRPDDPDPTRASYLAAVGKLFVRAQRASGAHHAAELWAAQRAVEPWRGLDDRFFRRVFHGVLGATANLRLGFGCNQSCGLCWQSRTWPDAPHDVLLTWVDELAQLGVSQLTVTGGEPTLHKALPAVLDRARHHGMRTMLQTNAVQLSKPAVLQRIGPQVDRFFVSFHAAEAVLSDAITQAPKTWRRTVAGIEAILAAGYRLGLNCVVDRRNVHHIADHGAFIVDRFVHAYPDGPVESVTYSRAQPYHDRALWSDSLVAMDEVRPGVLAAARRLRDAGVVVDVTSGSCGLPACVLDAEPTLIYLPPTEHLAAADPGFDPSQRAATACSRCVLQHRCQGPGTGYHDAFGDQGLRPFDTMPPISEDFPLTL